MMKIIKPIAVMLLAMLILIGVVKTIPGEPLTPEVLAAPKTYAALGDSITQAANACEPHQECPAKSWATGTYQVQDPLLGLDEPVTMKEHLQVLLKNKSTLEVFNNARSYTKVSDLPNQAQLAVTQKAEVVTILSGANDICVAEENLITTDDQFRESVKETFDILKTQLPQTKIVVASIPNIYMLWSANYTNKTAVNKWTTSSLCDSMLVNPTSFAKEDVERRERVLQRIIGFNKIWEEECGHYVNCRFDNNEVFNTVFSENELSPVDYFHPSQEGQKMLADTVWSSNFALNKFVLISKGKSSRSSDNAPIINISQPKNGETISGDKYRLKVEVESVNPLERVYADTQLGGVDLKYDFTEKIWYLQVDTTLAPNGLSTFFTVIAVDKEKEIAVSEKIKVTVDNETFAETPAPTETISEETSNPSSGITAITGGDQ